MIDKKETDKTNTKTEDSESTETSTPIAQIATDKNEDSELSFALEEMEHVIAYLCRTGSPVDEYHIDVCIESKHKFDEQGFLSSRDEIEFWATYRLVMESIQPATLGSIQETNPSQLWVKKNPRTSSRVKRIPLYYGITVCVLIVLTICLQIYYMIGIDVLQKTYELFNERSEIRDQINKLTEIEKGLGSNYSETSEMAALRKQESKVDQEFDANVIMMFRWNKVWQLGSQNQAAFSIYDEYKYEQNQLKLTESIRKLEESSQLIRQPDELMDLRTQLNLLEKERKLAEARNLFFSGRLSATYMVNLLEGHVLPLLFGCLGAFTLVLRSMHDAFSNSTFALKSCRDYNLRILLGSLIGISSGMFMGDDKGIPQGSYSPMVLAFLVGYNVEIMFSIMDSLAQKLMVRNRGYGKGSGGCRYNGMGGGSNRGGPQGGQRSGNSRMSRDPQSSQMRQNSRIGSDRVNDRYGSSSMARGNSRKSRDSQEFRSSRPRSDYGDSRYGGSSMGRRGSGMSRDSLDRGRSRGSYNDTQTDSVYGNSRMSRMSGDTQQSGRVRRSRLSSGDRDSRYPESRMSRGRSERLRDAQDNGRLRDADTDPVYRSSRRSRMSEDSQQPEEPRRRRTRASRKSRESDDNNEESLLAQQVENTEELQSPDNTEAPQEPEDSENPKEKDSDGTEGSEP